MLMTLPPDDVTLADISTHEALTYDSFFQELLRMRQLS